MLFNITPFTILSNRFHTFSPHFPRILPHITPSTAATAPVNAPLPGAADWASLYAVGSDANKVVHVVTRRHQIWMGFAAKVSFRRFVCEFVELIDQLVMPAI